MSSQISRDLIEFKIDHFKNHVERVRGEFEVAIGKILFASGVDYLAAKSEHKLSNQVKNNEAKIIIIDGNISSYAEKYDQIERSMRHYG